MIRNRQLNALVRDLDLERQPADLVARSRGTARRVHTLFDGLEFRVLRDRLFETLGPEEDPIDEGGFELDRAPARPRRGRRLARPSTPATRARSACTSTAPGAAGTGDGRRASPSPTATALAAWVDVAEPDPRRRRGARRPGWPTRRGRRCSTTPRGPMLALAARGWPLAGLVSDTALAAYLVQPDQRSYDLADLTLRYLKRELRTESEADQDQLSFDDRSTAATTAPTTAMLHARAVLDLAEALDGELEEHGGTRLLARRRAAAGRRARARWSRSASPSTSTTSSSSRATSPPRSGRPPTTRTP